MICDVLNDLCRREKLFGVVVRNLESELVLHGHDDLHVVQRVQTQVVDEVRLQSQLGEKNGLYNWNGVKNGKKTFDNFITE